MVVAMFSGKNCVYAAAAALVSSDRWPLAQSSATPRTHAVFWDAKLSLAVFFTSADPPVEVKGQYKVFILPLQR